MAQDNVGPHRRSTGELAGLGAVYFVVTLAWQWISHLLGMRPDYTFIGSAIFAAVLAILAMGVQAWWERRTSHTR